MTLYEETVAALAHDPKIGELYGALSAGDRSILGLLLDNDEGAGTTIEGSANAQFWACLSNHGWMVRTEGPMPDTGPALMLHYRLTDRGYRAIPVVFYRLAQA